MTARQRERHKSPVKRAEDLIYVVTHTVTCLSCDVLKPVLGAKWDQWQGKNGAHQVPFTQHLKGWLEAELVGDFGAVLPVIATQRLAPGVMNGFNAVGEKLFGRLYHWGAERSTAKWALEHGISKDSPDYQAHREKMYQSEAGHLGQMLEWTVLSTAGNVLWQKHVVNPRLPSEEIKTVKAILAEKSIAAVSASALVMGSRATWPEASQKRDRFMGRHVVMPVTKALGKPFGLDGKAIDQAANENAVPGNKITEAAPVPLRRAAPADAPNANDNFHAANDDSDRWLKKVANDTPAVPLPAR